MIARGIFPSVQDPAQDHALRALLHQDSQAHPLEVLRRPQPGPSMIYLSSGQSTRRAGQAPLGCRERLPEPEAGAGIGALRGALRAWLSPPRYALHRGSRIPGGREEPFSLGPRSPARTRLAAVAACPPAAGRSRATASGPSRAQSRASSGSWRGRSSGSFPAVNLAAENV